MRCLALAEELGSRGAEISWYGWIEVEWVRDLIRSFGWRILEPAVDLSTQAQAIHADLAIVDSYSPTGEFQELLRQKGVFVVSITDDFHRSFSPADLWVNPGVALGWDEPARARFLDGPEYVLLRSQVRSLRDLRSSTPTTERHRRRVVALLGGTDFSGLSAIIPSMAAELAESCDVEAGPSLETSVANLRWLPPGSDLLEHAALADLVVSPAGVSSWELLHIGAPLALVQATQNQCGNYEWMVKEGLAADLGRLDERLTGEALAVRVGEAFVSARQRALDGLDRVDGLGASRVADVIQELF